MRRLALLTFLAACHHAAPPRAPSTDPVLARLDVFGSHQVTREQLIADDGADLASFIHAVEQNDDAATAKLRARIVDRIEHLGHFAFVELAAITYFDLAATYLTVDLVDEADRARRMSFAPKPTGHHGDPDGLLALWGEYEDKMWPVIQAHGGKTDVDCPAWHCFTFADPSLTPYRDAFVARVPAQEAALAAVLADDADELARARAAYLLAHLADGDRVVALELAAFRDPSSLVRNDAMRVVAMIAMHHPEIDVPLAPVLAALEMPTTTDRNKASAILSGLASRPGDGDQILDAAGTVLVDMLRLAQPNNHDFAYAILKTASGQDLGEHDADAWQRWLDARAHTRPR